MTSSLVGSEMCIRDRTTPLLSQTTVVLAGPHHCLAGLQCCWQGHIAEPVSYTHLTLPTICSV
eukprot:5687813-Prorocentrum_lima.AAC.1